MAVANGIATDVIISNVAVVSNMICNLLSVSRLRRSGYKVIFEDEDKNGTHGRVAIVEAKNNRTIVVGIETAYGMYEVMFREKKKTRTHQKQKRWR